MSDAGLVASDHRRAVLCLLVTLGATIHVLGVAVIPTARAAATQSIVLSIDRELGRHRTVRGSVGFAAPVGWRTTMPRPSFWSFAQDAPDGCALRGLIGPAVKLGRGSPAAFVRRSLKPASRRAVVGRGRRHRGAWGIDEMRRTRRSQRSFFGVTAIRVAPQVTVELRGGLTLTGVSGQPCSEEAVRLLDPIPALLKIFSRVRVRAVVRDVRSS